MPLPWAPASLLSDTDDWSFTNSANRAMSDLATMGERLMQPVGQQVRSVVEQALPGPIRPEPDPQLTPQVTRQATPAIPRFSLGRVEDWLTPAGPQPPAPQLEQPATPPMPSTQSMVGIPQPAVRPQQSGMFSLPSLESFLGPRSGAAQGQASAPPSGTGRAAAAPEALGPIAEGDPRRFFETAGPYARRVEAQTGIPAKLSLAIAANETGYGQRRYMAGANNYHGIQARAGEAGAVPYKDWRPGPGGGQQFYDAAQRSFADPEAGFAGFASFLTDNPRYAPALARYRQTGDVDRLAADIHAAGYAEDPQYTTKIQSIMRGIPTPTGVGEVAAPAGVRPPDATGRQVRPPDAGLDVRGITEAYKGVPYTFGGPGGRGQGVGATTDCSGFVSAVWKNQYGLDLPAHTDTSYNALRKLGATEVSAADARPGDVVYYMGAGTGGAIAHHMGILAGPGKVLDMSTSGTSGAAVRDLGHAGRYVILRDPRVNQQAPERAQAPPPIVPTGIAERTGGEAMRTVQARTPAAAPQAQPEPLPAATSAPPEPMYDPREADEGPHEGANGAVAQAFRHVNGFLPSAEQLSALVSRVYGG